MLALGLALAVGAALLHVVIFWLESIAWESPRAMATFGIADAEEARITKPLAYNQGFYNLFLAIIALVGVVIAMAWSPLVGVIVALCGVAPMLAAALVLGLSSPAHRGAALKQGLLPLIATVLLVIELATAIGAASL